ncbi:hypothetical protein J2Y60_004052 [Arcicella sp. BE140]|nr:hypothetical protein [Arcicella sp. BE51]MDR6813840.1 hypothetical protein [Arcicella sp. BE140]MDR6825152.1 hypothetical protein [Arcicella sp. BE139]
MILRGRIGSILHKTPSYRLYKGILVASKGQMLNFFVEDLKRLLNIPMNHNTI